MSAPSDAPNLQLTAQPPALSIGARIVLAWAWFFRVLFDGEFAARVRLVETGMPALPSAPASPAVAEADAKETSKAEAPSIEAALHLLALFQREGRFVDFLEEEITTFPDAEVGAAARSVHEGCRKALRDHAKVGAVRNETEGSRVTVADKTPPSEVKLSGNVSGTAPFTGTLRHRGWRIDALSLPSSIAGHDARIVAPAEVEL